MDEKTEILPKFWEIKKIEEMNDAEWEALCDGCGLCCYRKIVDGYLWKKKILNTRIACNLLDTQTCRCKNYASRFSLQSECVKLDKKSIKHFKWLPQTCAYRLLAEGKTLPDWHPLISGNPESVKQAGICIKDPVSEKDADDWYDYVV